MSRIQRIYIVGIFIALLVALGALSYSTINTVNRVTENVSLIIDHPYSVSNATNEALNAVHHFVRDNPEQIDFTKEAILEEIFHIYEHFPEFDSLRAIINHRYLGPEEDLYKLNTRVTQLRLDIANSKEKVQNDHASGYEFYIEMTKEVAEIDRILTTINKFAHSKRDEILAQTLEDRQVYLHRLKVYMFLMISIFIGVTTFIGITIRQKLHLTKENENLSDKAKKNTERIRYINKIFQNQASSEQEFLDYSLNQVVELTESKIGYFFILDKDEQELILKSWSKGVMGECSIVNPKKRYLVQSTGIWGEAVRQQKAFIINDFEKFHPKKKGYPKDHVNLKKYMTAPIYENNEVVAVVGVANKDTNYTQDDLDQLQLLMNQVWNINKARQKEVENERFVRAVTNSPLSIVITDRNGNIEYVNEYFTQITGYSQEEAIGKNPKILKSGTQDTKFYKELWETISNGKTWKGEFQNISKNGNLFWESATISPIKDDNGEITSYVAVKEDVTIRKVLLQNISYNEQFKDSIFSSMKEGLIVQDKDYNTLVANKSACEIFEMSLQEIKSIGPWDERWEALSIEGNKIPYEEFPAIRVITEGVTIDNFVMSLIMGDNKRKYLAISSRPIYDDNEEIIQAVSTIRDITELIESNIALSASEQKYRDLFELSADPGMIIKDAQIVDVNDTAVDLFGCYDKEQLIGKNPIDLSPEIQPDNILSTTHYMNVNRILDRKGSHRFEWVHKKFNGVFFPAEVMLTQINENGNTCTHVVLRDISERKAQEQIILDQLKEKDVLLAEIHHRVKNNMAVISGLIQLEVFKSNNKKVNTVLNSTVNKIKSIATIHNQIYSSTDLRNISMGNIISLLVDSHQVELCSTKKIDIPIYLDIIDDVPINVNQALPFGLLLDELLLNYIRIVTDKGCIVGFEIKLFQKINDVHLVVNLIDSDLDFQGILKNLDRTLIDVFVSQLCGDISFTNHGKFKTEIVFQLKEVNGTVAYQDY